MGKKTLCIDFSMLLSVFVNFNSHNINLSCLDKLTP